MNDVNSFLISLQEFNRQFRRLNEFDVVSLWTRIRSWVRSLTASVRERGSILSPELAQEVWKLRGNLWKLNKSQRKETGLLWTIWETQNLCDDLNLFADFFEGVSAQYNLVKKMIEMEALHDASICSSKLYSQLTQKLNKSLNTSEAFVVNGEKYYGNDKATNVVVAVSLAVLTCGSKLFEIDSLKLYNAAVRSVELWIRQSHQIATFKTHLNSALYHVEKILGQLGSVIEKSSLSNFKCIANFIQSYFRICQLGDHSVSSGVSVFVTGLPLHLLTPVVWDCFSGLFFDQERDPVYQWDGLKLMNGVFQRILRVQRNDQVGPIRKLTQEYFTLKLDYLPLIPDWFAVHVSTALTLQITSTGKTPPINHTHLHHLQECLEKYRKFLKQFASLHNSQMVSIFTALGLLFYAIRSEQTAVQCWRNETQIADFITGVMILTAKCITAFPRKALMEAITAQKLPGYLSQYISSLIRVCLVSKEYRNLLGSHQESLWMLMELMMESLPDPDPGPGYRCLPRDLRLVMDSALDNVYTQKSHRSIPDSFDLYSFVIQLYFFVHQNWIQKRELQTQCLYSKIVDTVFHYSRQILKSESCSPYGMKLLKKVIPQLLECFPAAPVEDLKKLIGLYTRYSLQTINSSVDERLSYSWLFYKVPYEQEVSALKLFSQEVMAIMKHTKALKIDLNKLHHLKGFYFTSHGSPRNGISRTHQIRMKALIVVLLGYIDSMESDQVLQLLTECQWSLEHCSEREPFSRRPKLSVYPCSLLSSIPSYFSHTSLLEDLDHECQKRLNQVLVELGNLLVVCIVHLSHNLFMDWTGDKLVFVRYCLHDVPLIVAISSPQQKQLNSKQDEMQTFLSSPLNFSETVQEMSKILEDSKTGFENRRIPDGVQDKKSHLENWWRDRVNFDQQIKQRIQSVETELGPWKLLLSGHLSPRDASLSKAKSFLAKILVRSFFCSSLRTEITLGLTRIFLSGLRHLTDDHLDKLAEFYFQMTDDSETDLDAIYRALVESRESGDSREEIPDTNERICMTVIRQPRRRNRRFSFKRETSYCGNQSNAINAIKSQECMNPTSVLLVLDYKAEPFPWESFNCYRNQSFYRVPNLCFARYLHLIRRHQYDDSSSTVVDFRSAFYVLDPEGDLLDSRETFQNWFQSINDWIGITPQQDLLLRFLQEKSVFLYFGHGAGEKHFNPRELRKYLIKSIGVLMGCSSAKLRSPGEGSILQYLAAGSCCCIGNLWIVSDAEINRFSKTLVSLWIHSTNQSSEQNSLDAHNGFVLVDVAVGVNRSRSSCRLTHLVGAAPVTYGIPTQIQFKERKNPLATPVHKFTS
eukprot:g2550.t1